MAAGNPSHASAQRLEHNPGLTDSGRLAAHHGDLGGLGRGGGWGARLWRVGGHAHVAVLAVARVHGGAAAAQDDEQQVEDGRQDEAWKNRGCELLPAVEQYAVLLLKA